MRMRIGFVGLGTMGEPIANNLRKAGHDLTVWNRTAARAGHIVSKGGKLAATPRECATSKDLVFTCVSDEQALDAVLDGPDGVLAGMIEGGLLIDLSTAGTRAARSVQERTAKKGIRFIACPILGS
jgi:3-hydroxyisobutyrate dehydrogenase-like beta-hydroxyacid dehydrogenase